MTLSVTDSDGATSTQTYAFTTVNVPPQSVSIGNKVMAWRVLGAMSVGKLLLLRPLPITGWLPSAAAAANFQISACEN